MRSTVRPSMFGVKCFCRSTSTILAGSDGCSFDDAPFAGRRWSSQPPFQGVPMVRAQLECRGRLHDDHSTRMPLLVQVLYPRNTSGRILTEPPKGARPRIRSRLSWFLAVHGRPSPAAEVRFGTVGATKGRGCEGICKPMLINALFEPKDGRSGRVHPQRLVDVGTGRSDVGAHAVRRFGIRWPCSDSLESLPARSPRHRRCQAIAILTLQLLYDRSGQSIRVERLARLAARLTRSTTGPGGPRRWSRFEATLEASCLDKRPRPGVQSLGSRLIGCGDGGGTQASRARREQRRGYTDFQPTGLPRPRKAPRTTRAGSLQSPRASRERRHSPHLSERLYTVPRSPDRRNRREGPQPSCRRPRRGSPTPLSFERGRAVLSTCATVEASPLGRSLEAVPGQVPASVSRLMSLADTSRHFVRVRTIPACCELRWGPPCLTGRGAQAGTEYSSPARRRSLQHCGGPLRHCSSWLPRAGSVKRNVAPLAARFARTVKRRSLSSLWRKSVLPGSTGPILCTRLRPMAMGTTRDDGSQQAMWVATADLPQGGGHPFYERLNEILGAAGFDAFVEQLCAPFYARDGAAESGAGPVFPAAAGRVFRRPRLGAGRLRGVRPIR